MSTAGAVQKQHLRSYYSENFNPIDISQKQRPEAEKNQRLFSNKIRIYQFIRLETSPWVHYESHNILDARPMHKTDKLKRKLLINQHA